jgi:hypothetical protein
VGTWISFGRSKSVLFLFSPDITEKTTGFGEASSDDDKLLLLLMALLDLVVVGSNEEKEEA